MMERGSNGRLATAGRSWRIHLLVILIYTLLALVLTWPLVGQFSTHVPGDGADDPPLTWNLWWVKHALLEQGTNPFDCDYLFYPQGINLAFYTLTVLNGLLSIPLQATLGLVPASNILLLSSFVLSGYGAFLLAGYLSAASHKPTTGSSPAAGMRLVGASVGGLLYAFASSKLFYAALGQWNIASSQWIPFYILYLVKSRDAFGQWRYPLLAALFLLFQAYAELTYASFLVLFTGLWAVWRCWIGRHRLTQELRQLLPGLLAISVMVAMGLIPVLAMMVPDMLVEGDIFVEGSGFADVFSADLIGFLIPTMHHSLLGSWADRFDFDHTVGQHIYPGYVALGLALVGVAGWWRHAPPRSRQQAKGERHPVRFWALSALVFWLLALGPTLRINGNNTGVPLPFALVAQLPFFKGNRYPSRYSVLLILSLAVLVAFGVQWLLASVAGAEKARKRSTGASNLRLGAAGLLLAGLLLVEHVSIPLPLSDMRVPPVYTHIAREMPGDLTLLDLPVAWRNGFRVTGTQHPIIMFQQYYQTAHSKRILAGNTSRNPPLKFQYFTTAPVINTLVALETGHPIDPAVVARDRSLAAQVLRFFDIGAIVVHPAQTGPAMIPYLEATMPIERFFDDAETVAYRVELPPLSQRWMIEPGDGLGGLSYAEGWGPANPGVVWAQRRDARLLVPLDGQEQQMAFQAYAPAEGQRLGVRVNGRATRWIDMAAGWQEYEITLPAESVHAGLNEIWLRFETTYPAGQVALSPRTIGETGAESPVNLVVQSAGQEVGSFGHIYVDGQDVSPGERGYNVAVIEAHTGAVVQAAAFDTHLDGEASQALAAFLRTVPPGRIVVVAACDEASRLLGQDAVDALQGIGAAGDLQGRFRWGHAIIGVQGAAPGTALEALDWMRPVNLVAGEGATEPALAAAFSTISFTAVPNQ